MTSLDLAIVAGFLAVSFGLVVLLTIFEKPVRRVVVSEVLRSLLILVAIVAHGAVAGVQLFENLAARLRAMLTFRVILRSFLNTIVILHQLLLLSFGWSLSVGWQRQGQARAVAG